MYGLYNKFFKNIDIRSFEQFFTGIDIAKTVLKRENKTQNYADELNKTKQLQEYVNQSLFDLCEDIYKTKAYSGLHLDKLFELYALSEMNYCSFINKLKQEDFAIFNMLPHGKEELNI